MSPDTSRHLVWQEKVRREAESRMGSKVKLSMDVVREMAPEETQLLFHELRVHHIELEIQNEELRNAKEALEISRARFVDLYDRAPVGYCTVNAAGLITQANLTLASLLGVARRELIGVCPLSDFVFQADQDIWYLQRQLLLESGVTQVRELRLRSAGLPDASGLTTESGALVWVQLTASLTQVGVNAQQLQIAVSDITAIKDHQGRLEHIAHFDALTNLPNRLLLADRMKQAMAQAQRRSQKVAVAYLDLDGFKNVNDCHGHHVGNELLIHLATAMNDALREGDTLARLGGDEFVAVLTDLDDFSACMPMLHQLLEAAATPVQLGDDVLQTSASIGVTFYPQDHGVEPDQLLRQADQAMYQAKMAGKSRYHVFDAAQDSNMRIRHESLLRIRLAMEQGEFVLHYQPKVNMGNGQVIGAEALIRWQHPELGLLAPAKFLPVIEDHPLSVEVGEWVIETALAQIATWHASGLNLPVSVNIGARQLQQEDFVLRLQTILARHPGVDPTLLELEVLETSALADMAQVSQAIEECHQIGVKFALDDFGTGYSSLTYLKRLRVASLKIDQSFVCDMLSNPEDLAILEGVIGLAGAFKREVIAEGVETVAHGTALLRLGCVLAQGSGIARAMAGDQMPEWVKSWQPDAAWCAPMPPGKSIARVG